uniref:DNA2/NAM7 helicase helicase domain-containing protein n=1 Tax=Ditylenchus dipsaci TaxID=166011 RepID=A0A915ELC8_9BILA
MQLKEEAGGKKKTDLFVYRGVKVGLPEMHKQTGEFIVYAQLKTSKRMRWNKRLVYGSLVCLSADDFQSSFLFGVVWERSEEKLWQGQIGLKFDNASLLSTSANTTWWSHQPFLRPTNMSCWLLSRSNSKSQFHLPDICVLIKTEQEPLTPLLTDINQLGTAILPTHLKMDQSQFEALRYSLNTELTIIQGPPGTGKTYIGLQIAKLLLKNRQLWNNAGDRRPMLVVCYTNHALDQFLEGINTFLDDGIVRIGGRSKNKNMEGGFVFVKSIDILLQMGIGEGHVEM